jgi:hypothetical protein
MTTKIPKSATLAIPDFELRVAAHAKEMRDWAAQMRLARQHAGDDSIPPLERYVERPMPRELPIIESAVDEDGMPAFEVVDDGPTPAQLLGVRRAELAAEVAKREAEEMEKIFPALRSRMTEVRRQDVAASDARIIGEAMRKADDERVKLTELSQRHFRASQRAAARAGLVGAIMRAIVGKSADAAAAEAEARELEPVVSWQADAVSTAEAAWSDHAALLEKERDPSDHEFVASYLRASAAADRVRRWAAAALNEVADLKTIDEAGAWQVPPPPAGE